jgi:hypothetical protein
MTTPMDDVLTAGDASRMPGVPGSTLHDWAARRERDADSPGPDHRKLSSRHRRWMRADVVEWLAASRF